jgi:hypothetical protein
VEDRREDWIGLLGKAEHSHRPAREEAHADPLDPAGAGILVDHAPDRYPHRRPLRERLDYAIGRGKTGAQLEEEDRVGFLDARVSAFDQGHQKAGRQYLVASRLRRSALICLDLHM